MCLRARSLGKAEETEVLSHWEVPQSSNKCISNTAAVKRRTTRVHAFILLKSAFPWQCFPYSLKLNSLCLLSLLWSSVREMWDVHSHPHCMVGNRSWRRVAYCFSLFKVFFIETWISKVYGRQHILFAVSGHNLHRTPQLQLAVCTCQLNKLHYIRAICLSKLINPIGLKVKNPNEHHACLLKLHL